MTDMFTWFYPPPWLPLGEPEPEPSPKGKAMEILAPELKRIPGYVATEKQV